MYIVTENGVVTQLNFLDSLQVQRYDKERREADMVLEHNYSQFGFDYFFDRAQQERAAAASLETGTSPADTSRKSLLAMAQKYLDDSEDSDSDQEQCEPK